MNITNFTYTIFSVNENAKCMEIIYSVDGYPAIQKTTRLPFENEHLEDIILMFAPISFWTEQFQNTVIPEIGKTGTINIL